MKKILLAEDDESLGYILSEYLRLNDLEVIWARNGIDALAIFREEAIDLCLFDVMMPKMDGFELAKKIRESDWSLPIIFLTAKALKVDKLKGFNTGADDYITKPVDEEELLARIRAVIRRSETNEANADCEIIPFGNNKLLTAQRALHLKDQVHTLTEKETILLKMLLEKRNSLLSREYALKEIWGKNDYFNRRSMDVHITHLRKILKEDPALQIINVHGKGFVLKV